MGMRTVVERGPKGKRTVAFALDWPGWSRGAKTPELALELLESYRARYQPVAKAAGRAVEFDSAGPLEVVEDRVGTGSTDFDAGLQRGRGKRMRSWNLPFLLRHSAMHTLDHAWEMEDKDLSAG